MIKQEYYVEEVIASNRDNPVYYIRHTNPKRYTFGGGYNSLHDAKKACDSLNAPPPTITSRRVYPP